MLTARGSKRTADHASNAVAETLDCRRSAFAAGGLLRLRAPRDWFARSPPIFWPAQNKCDLLVVSSGAIALGRSVLKLPAGAPSSRIAAAAAGQVRSLAHGHGPRRWAATADCAFQHVALMKNVAGLNARSIVAKLLEAQVPAINETTPSLPPKFAWRQ